MPVPGRQVCAELREKGYGWCASVRSSSQQRRLPRERLLMDVKAVLVRAGNGLAAAAERRAVHPRISVAVGVRQHDTLLW